MPSLNLLDLPDDVLVEVVDCLDAALWACRRYQRRSHLARARMTCKRFDRLFTPVAFCRFHAEPYEPLLRATLVLCNGPHLRKHVREVFIAAELPPPMDSDDEDYHVDSSQPGALKNTEVQLFDSIHEVVLNHDLFSFPDPNTDDLRDAILEGLQDYSFDALYALVFSITPCLSHIESKNTGQIADFAHSLMADVIRTRTSISTIPSCVLNLKSIKISDMLLRDWAFLTLCPSLKSIDIQSCRLISLRDIKPALRQLTSFETEYCELNMDDFATLLQNCPNLIDLRWEENSTRDPRNFYHAPDRRPLCRRQLGDLLRAHRPPLRKLHLHRAPPRTRFIDADDAPLGDLSSLNTLHELDVDKGYLIGSPELQVKLADILPVSLRRLYLKGDHYDWPDEDEKLAHDVRYDYECHDLFSNERFPHLRAVSLEGYTHPTATDRPDHNAMLYRDHYQPDADEERVERFRNCFVSYLVGFEPSGRLQVRSRDRFQETMLVSEASWTEWRHPRPMLPAPKHDVVNTADSSNPSVS